MVERDLAKVEVTSSSLVARSKRQMAGWQNGHAADCKSVHLGSTPGPASILRLDSSKIVCPGGEIGRHKGFKIPRPQVVPVRVRPRAPLTNTNLVSSNMRA